MVTVLLGLKLVPVTVTVVPAKPEAGLAVTEGVVAVNGVVAVAAPLLADIVCAPAAAVDGTKIAAEKPPEALVVIDAGVVTKLVPSSATLANVLAGKFVPVTVTVVPIGPEVGEMVREAFGLMVNGAESVEVPPVADIVCAPAAAADGIENVALKPPDELAVTVAGVVVILVPSKFTAMAEPAGKFVPVTVTEVPEGPNDGTANIVAEVVP